MIRSMSALMSIAAISYCGSAMAASHKAIPATVTPPPASSSAATLNFDFNFNGATATLTNQVLASGSAPPNYNKTTQLPKYTVSKTFGSGLQLSATVLTPVNTVTAGGTGGGGITATANANTGAVTLQAGLPGQVILSATAQKIASRAVYNVTKAGVVTLTGGAAIQLLRVNAPIFGVNNVAFSGSATPNKVLYHNNSNSIVVYANRQTTTKNTAGKITGFTVDAIALHATNFKYGPYTINGDFTLGTCIAK